MFVVKAPGANEQTQIVKVPAGEFWHTIELNQLTPRNYNVRTINMQSGNLIQKVTLGVSDFFIDRWHLWCLDLLLKDSLMQMACFLTQ